MAIIDGRGTVSLQDLIISSLAQTEALANLLIEKGLISEKEFMEKLLVERASYQAMFEKED